MDIVFTHHVQYRLIERDISTERVRQVILQAKTREKIEQNLLMVRGSIEGKTLEVIYKEEGKKKIVITSYYL